MPARAAFNRDYMSPRAMDPTTGPRDYHLFDSARSIEVYADPTPVRVDYLPKVSDWAELSRASSAGRREPLDSVKAHLKYPTGLYYMDRDGNNWGRPDITLEFTYSGSAAIPLLEEWGRDPERYCDPNVYLWRFRVTDRDSRELECCFRAYVFGLSHDYVPGKVYGVFGVIDSQPLVVEASPPVPRAAGR